MDTIHQGARGDTTRHLQRLLNLDRAEAGLVLLKVDGDFGEKTAQALSLYQDANNLAVADAVTWRALEQAEARSLEQAELEHLGELRELPPEATRGADGVIRWEHFDGPVDKQPRNNRELIALLGNPGTGSVDPAWKKRYVRSYFDATAFPGTENLIRGRYVTVHHTVEPYAREALRRARIACPEYVITVLGGFNFRHIRHDPSRDLSRHAFAAALDVNPKENFAKSFARGQSPRAFSPAWWAIWPNGMPQNFVEAFISCGWAWGSDWDEDGDTTDTTYHDPMHFEWVARDGKRGMV